MTSAALDACLCLLLVSAAAVTVTSVAPAQPESEADRADAVAETLAVETAYVRYTLEPPGGERPTANPEYERSAHGTLASLLAQAAVSTVRVDGEPLTRTRADFAAAVRETVRARLPARTQVVVEHSPYPGSHLGRELTVGPMPPTNADVHAATVRVPSGISRAENASVVAAARGFDGLARIVAGELVSGLFPPRKGRLALAGDHPVDALVERRYVRASELYGVRTRDAIEDGDTRTANRRLAASMRDRIAADLRRRFESPEEAADALRLADVRISVRTWSP